MAKQVESCILENDPLPQEIFKEIFKIAYLPIKKLLRIFKARTNNLYTDRFSLKPNPARSTMDLVDEANSELEIKPVKCFQTPKSDDEE
ncbi:hypothetical protein NPIL_52981 [Nephila pilipes]|uniref:Uncharacterized protein n=1 Tax=Nephila pilipes TaxID=299642 RepID=A0A8X6QQ85_NEPPI|nr:hypothetical protein NPIL_52981 [Nephila pilipes]